MEVDGKPVSRIIDFGIAKAKSHRLSDETLLTHVGALIGTLVYISPEQADSGGEDIDTRSDVYSLGVVLYELLSSSLPFDFDALPTTMRCGAQSGRRDEAFADLDHAVEAGFANAQVMRTDAGLNPLRNDSRFDKLDAGQRLPTRHLHLRRNKSVSARIGRLLSSVIGTPALHARV
jgi:serine/threonine protein kinase